ncbi:MAG: 30S ribosomal protein S6e [Halobacteria archaeon]|nr:30S ribosomal protein S6e [Halobacteria archaeon]
MTDMQVIVSDTETGTSYQLEADVDDFVGSSVGETVDGSLVGLDGYEIEITGGSDDTGRPLRGDVEGREITEVLVSGGTGFNPSKEGERKRVTVRGGEIGDATAQLNTKIVEEGDESVESLLGLEESEDEETEEE